MIHTYRLSQAQVWLNIHVGHIISIRQWLGMQVISTLGDTWVSCNKSLRIHTYMNRHILQVVLCIFQTTAQVATIESYCFKIFNIVSIYFMQIP